MSKLYILGIVASGKTTLAKRLSASTGISCYELDGIVHPDRPPGAHNLKPTPQEQAAHIARIDSRGDWILEGVYRPSYHHLFGLADRILLLDPPLWLRRARIIARFVKQNLGLEACGYKPDRSMPGHMFRWTREFEGNREAFFEMLRPYEYKLTVYKGLSIKGIKAAGLIQSDRTMYTEKNQDLRE